jgi:hypothetical protein
VEAERLRLPTRRQRAFPRDADDVLGRVQRALFDPRPAPPSARLVIEAVALPFVRPHPAIWAPTPAWMPVYWHRHLSQSEDVGEAAELLSLLDEMAAPLSPEEPERGWDPAWAPMEGMVTLAVRHVRRQARVQAEAIRAGLLPQSWLSLLFDPAPRSDQPGSRVDPSGWPPALRHVFDALVATRPARLPSRQ